jgi:predicted metal-dependent phosphoesterase TrpH
MSDIHPIDFQIQTTASDGLSTPAECVQMAKRNSVTAIAITDHDTVGGVREAIDEGEKLGVRVLPGIEISAEDRHMHILGLGIDPTHQGLLDFSAACVQKREDRAREMVKRFQEDGFSVSWEKVRENAKGIVASPHVVQAIMEDPANAAKLKSVSTKHDFYDTFLYDGSKYAVHLTNISAKDAIALIHDARGLAIWSHPPVPGFVGDNAGLRLFLSELLEYGLDGLELFGPTLTEADVRMLEDLVLLHHLVATAGSDFHKIDEGKGKTWPRSASTVGEYPTYGRSLEGMIEKFDQALAGRRV